MTAYEKFQMDKYGNVLPDQSNTPEPDLFESRIEELNRLAEWTDAMAERELMEYE